MEVISLEDHSFFPLSRGKNDILPTREEIATRFASAIEQRSSEEIIRHHALVGPHADKPAFSLDGKDAGTYASQGQQRSLAICFKLAELSLLEERMNQRPILLLDDVMSELDADRRSTLIEYVDEVAQTFITTTNLDYFTQNTLSTARIITLPAT